MDIKTLIEGLDTEKLRVFGGDESVDMFDYHVMLHNAYPALRRAALAGAELAKVVGELDMVDWNDRTPKNAHEARLYVNDMWRSQKNQLVTAYLHAINDKVKE